MYLEFCFGAATAEVEVSGQALTLKLTNDVVFGSASEQWPLLGDGEVSSQQQFTFWCSERQVCGIGCAEVGELDMAAASQHLYAQLLDLTGELALQRIWNFVPHINDRLGELDQYMLFCQGRAAAFQADTTPLLKTQLPAASALGTPGDLLWIVFIADVEPARTVENPLQTPAYEYPRRYGPSSPSFARGALLQAGRELVISGTASIRKSESLHQDDPVAQAALALDNLSQVIAHANFGSDMSTVLDRLRSGRIYLRDERLWQQVEPTFADYLQDGMAMMNVVQAEICRPELLVEVEAHFCLP